MKYSFIRRARALVGMATALVRIDPPAGRELLRQLVDASPGRPEAANALTALEMRH